MKKLWINNLIANIDWWTWRFRNWFLDYHALPGWYLALWVLLSAAVGVVVGRDI